MTMHRQNVAIIIAYAVVLTFLYKHNFFYAVQRNVRKRTSNSAFDNQQQGNRVAAPYKSEAKKTIQWFDIYLSGRGLRTRVKQVRMNQCEYNNCELLEHYIVPERAKMIFGPLSADAVIFQGLNIGQMLPPTRRDENQVFVFAEKETWWDVRASERMMEPIMNKPHVPQNSNLFSMKTLDVFKQFDLDSNIFRFRDVFNWTMTYRQDSDIYMPYGEIVSKQVAIDKKYISPFEAHETKEKDYDRIFYSKNKEVVWLVSHCNTKSKREDYVKQLRKYINVDIYGACGNYSCPKGTYKASDKNSCLYKIIKEYKFILSFENTFHTDYVSEKLFSWFPHDIVPVVYGMADYESFTPSGTIINAADFKSPQDLAIFMTRLGADNNKYIYYLRNKNRYYSAGMCEMHQKAYCNLCEKLNNLDANRRTYPDIGLWWQLNDTSKFQNLYLQAQH